MQRIVNILEEFEGGALEESLGGSVDGPLNGPRDIDHFDGQEK